MNCPEHQLNKNTAVLDLKRCSISRLNIEADVNPALSICQPSKAKEIVPDSPQEFLCWMKKRADQADLYVLTVRLKSIIKQHQSIYDNLRQIEKDEEVARKRVTELKFSSLLLRIPATLVYGKLLKSLESKHNVVVVITHSVLQTRTELIKDLFELEKAVRHGNQRQINKAEGRLGRDLQKIEAYTQFSQSLNEKSYFQWLKLKDKLKVFKDEFLPAIIRSAVPIATGLITFNLLAGAFNDMGNPSSVLIPLVGSGITAALTATAVVWNRLRDGVVHSDEFKSAIRGTVRTLSIGAGIQTILLLQHYLEKSGLGPSNSWNKLLLFSIAAGLLDATIGYCVDVSQLVGDKLEKFYADRLGKDRVAGNPLQAYLKIEYRRMKLILSDLSDVNRRCKLRKFMEEEGINSSKLTKSVLFDLTLGAIFGLIGAHLNVMRSQSKSLTRNALTNSGSKMLSWSEKLMTRGVRNSLTKSQSAIASSGSKAMDQIGDSLKELIETVVE